MIVKPRLRASLVPSNGDEFLCPACGYEFVTIQKSCSCPVCYKRFQVANVVAVVLWKED